MSFIRDIVSVNENESLDAKKNLTRISAEIKRFQDKTKDCIDSNYGEFLPNLLINEICLSEGDKLGREVEDLLQSIESDTKQDLYSANDEIRQYQDELDEIRIGIRTSLQLLKIDEYLQCLEDVKANKEYLIEMEIIGKLKTLINNPADQLLKKLACYENIKLKYVVESEMLLHNLKQCFEQLVQFNQKTFQNTKSVTLKISKDENQLNDAIVALFNAKYNSATLCNFLLENVFHPIIIKPVSIAYDNDDDDYVQLSLSYSLKELPDNLRPNYKVVFKNVYEVVECLKLMNIQLSDTKYVLGVFGEHMKQKLLDLLIKECLEYAIPGTMDEMNGSTLVADILECNRFLIESSILNEETDQDLMKYAENIGILFRNRFCTNVLNTSIDIMRKDLHDMSLISMKNYELNDSQLLFPKSMVSKNTLELISLMEKVIRESQTTDKDTTQRLLSIILLIIDQYLMEVPKYHEKMLSNIPQQTALFHNNCMYLAFWLSKNLTDVLHVENPIKQLQTLGTEHFMKQVKNQQTQFMEILREFDISDGISEIGIGPQKIIRQCLRQLDLLKNVWQTILPDILYAKTMSTLLNDFCTEIIRKIMAIEDLPTALSNELVEIIGIIEDRASGLFQDKHEIIHVKLWMKLMQMKMILNASLVQITDQWSEGKGPLTLHYKPDEIKHLIRALFQNTERRALALASII